MPCLTIRTNQTIEQPQRLLREASTLIAGQLGKSERYVMVSLEPVARMLFGGSGAAAAYLELKSLGLQPPEVPALSKALCELMQRMADIPAERVYIEFSSPERPMWGWNGATF